MLFRNKSPFFSFFFFSLIKALYYCYFDMQFANYSIAIQSLQEKRHNTTNIIAIKKNRSNIYTIASLGLFIYLLVIIT